MAENKVSDTVNDMVNSMVEDINSAQNGSNKVSAIKDNVGYDMSRVHSANLKILKEIDRICRKYKIQYALDAGTLIGAVRHKGFIPWDDDADIVFTRNQFEAFKKVVRRELPDTMELVEPDSFHGGKAFFDFTPRIIYKKSRMHPEPLNYIQDGNIHICGHIPLGVRRTDGQSGVRTGCHVQMDRCSLFPSHGRSG